METKYEKYKRKYYYNIKDEKNINEIYNKSLRKKHSIRRWMWLKIVQFASYIILAVKL